MVNMVFVGRYVGIYAIGGLTIAFPVQVLMISEGLLISIGSSTFAARYFGEKNIQKLKYIIINSLVLTLGLLLLTSFLIFLFKKPIIYVLGASSNTFVYADKYISIILIGGIFQSLSLVACYIMKALGNALINLYSYSLGTACNIIFCYILIVNFKLGVSGAGFAFVISQLVTFAYTMHKFRFVIKKLGMHFILRYYKLLKMRYMKDIIETGFSTFIVEISDAVVGAFLNNLLMLKDGDNAVIIIGIITKISMFMFITIIGISLAMQPIIAYNYGSGNFKRMKRVLKITIKAVTITSLVLLIVFMTFSDKLIGFFVKDSELLKKAQLAFRICISLIPLTGIYYICIYYYQAVGKTKLSFFLSIYRQLVVFIPAAVILVELFGTIGAWIAYPVSDLVSFITSLYFIRKAIKGKYNKYKRKAKIA